MFILIVLLPYVNTAGKKLLLFSPKQTFMTVEVEIFQRQNTSGNILLCLRNECNSFISIQTQDSYMPVAHLFLPHLTINMLRIQTDCVQLPKLLNNTETDPTRH